MTLVLDASAIVEFLLGSSKGMKVAAIMGRHDADLHAPELITAESLSALRALERRTALTESRAGEAVRDLLAFPVHRYPTHALAPRVWSLRGQVTIYDAHYVALAEVLGAPLLTGDRRLAAALGALVEVITV